MIFAANSLYATLIILVLTLQTVTCRLSINEFGSGDRKPAKADTKAIVKNVWREERERLNESVDQTDNRSHASSPEIKSRIQNGSNVSIVESSTDYPLPFKTGEISRGSAEFSKEEQDQVKSSKKSNVKFSFKKCATTKCNSTNRKKNYFLNVRRIDDQRPVVNGENPMEDTNESVKTERRYRSIRDEYLVNETENFRATGNRSKDDYYAQRRAVMERFYARQRQIADAYSKQLAARDKPEEGNVTRQDSPRTAERGSLNGTGSIWNEVKKVEKGKSQERPIGWYQLKINEDELTNNNNNTSQRNISRDSVQSTSCKDIPVSGKLPAKSLDKGTRDLIEKQKRQDFLTNRSRNETAIPTQNGGDERWGQCEGKVVYQHNLLLGLHGPSMLDATFEVILQEPVCISCVEALRYNQTRAVVTLVDGGRGNQFARLKLKGYKNEGFSYILKVWGVKKTGDNCSQ